VSFFNGVNWARAAPPPFDRDGIVEGVDISLFYLAIFTIWFILNAYSFLSWVNL